MVKIFGEVVMGLTSVWVGGPALVALIGLLFVQELQTLRPHLAGPRFQAVAPTLVAVLSVLVGLILLAKVLK